VFGANLEHDGAIGPAFSTSAMPAPTAFGTVVAVDDYLLSIGGKPQIYTAGVSATGRGAHWALWPARRMAGGDAAARGAHEPHRGAVRQLRLRRGRRGFDGPGLDTVFSAQVRF